MSQTGYSKYETGENDIPTATLIELARFHGVSVDYILGLTDEKTPYAESKTPGGLIEPFRKGTRRKRT